MVWRSLTLTTRVGDTKTVVYKSYHLHSSMLLFGINLSMHFEFIQSHFNGLGLKQSPSIP